MRVARDPEQAEQAHHVAEAEAGRVIRGAADRLDERFEMRFAQLPRVEWRHPPILAVGEEVVGGRAHTHVRREQVLPAPCVATVGREADRYVGDEADLLRRARKLAVEVELQPLVERHPAGERASYRRDSLAARMSELGRPAAPGRSKALGDGAEGGVVLERLALPAYTGLHAGRIGRDLEDGFERAGLEAKHRVVVDESLRVEGERLISQGLQLGGAELGAWQLFDPQVQRVQKAPRRRVIRTGFLVWGGRLRAEGVDEQHGRALAPGHAPELAKVRQVTDAPAFARARRVDLRGPTPGAAGRRLAPGGRDRA